MLTFQVQELAQLAVDKKTLKQRKRDLREQTRIMDMFAIKNSIQDKISSKSKCDKAIATWIMSTLQSFNVVCSASFIDMIRTISVYGGEKYSPPGRFPGSRFARSASLLLWLLLALSQSIMIAYKTII